jgi:DNA-binding CsgD family transcriptional regulator
VIYANAAAMEIASSKDGLAVTANRIALTSSRDQPAFMKALAEIARGQTGRLCCLEVCRPLKKPPHRVLLLSVPHSRDIPPELLKPADGLSLIAIMNTQSGQGPDPAILRPLFSLTHAEARVASRLVAGRSVEDIADEMTVSVETVRTHIRHMLSKTSTGRQGEFISLVLRTTPFHRFEK